MLEILLLIVMAKRVGAAMREKGRKGGWYQFLLVGFWFGGEIAGFMFGAMLTGGRSGGLSLYVFALIGAAAGAAITFMIVGNISSDISALQSQIMQGNMRRCPHCGNATLTAAKVCVHCQREIPIAFVTTSSNR